MLECINEHGLTGVAVKRLGLGDTFIEHGSQAILRERLGLDPASVADAARELVASRPANPRVVTIGRKGVEG